jgi:putative endonuclease
MNRRKIGAAYEKEAAAYLEKQGYRILQRNYRCRLGEIDLVAEEGTYLVFVEVKYRSGRTKGDPLEAVHAGKQRTIRKTALWYLAEHGIGENRPCRFDVVGMTGEEIRLIKNAF